MAKDAEQSYCEAQKDVRPVDFVLCGYYGRHNLGDDMALKAFADNMVNRCGADSITLLSADSKNTKCKYINNVVHRFNLVKIYRIMKRTNVFVLGGGSILQDATSSRSMFYYTHIAGKAKSLGCKVMLYSNGVGPIIKKHNRIRAVKLLNKADMITVRDRRSQVYMRSIGVKNENIMLTADETFTLNKDAIAEPYEGLGEGKYLCINLRNSDINDKFIQGFSEFLNKAAEKYGYIPVLLPVHYSKDISLDDVSREVDISPYYFSKVFKEATGENFIEYLTNVRISKAKEMLQAGDSSMKEICSAVGYSDPNYFSRTFKKNVGVTPTEFKEGK